MNTQQSLTKADLARVFTPSPDATEQVGIEVEVGIVDPATGCSVAYEGASGARVLLDTLTSELSGTPIMDGPHLVGVELPDGSSFSLETGGALEYSSIPALTLAQGVGATTTALTSAAAIADRLGIALLSGGSLPFTPRHRIPWNPKPRVEAMRGYFRRLGESGSYADAVMALILSTQTSLDYTDEDDLLDKLRLHILASPIVAAMFVNSPLDNGFDAGVQSRRMQFWTKFEPIRCGVLGFMLEPRAGLADLITWATDLRMIYRRAGDSHVAAPRRTFAQAMETGFGDGTWPTYEDWETHLSQLWPHVRARRTLELRASDGLPWPHFSATPAIWVGLTYQESVRRKAIDLLSGLTAADLNQAVNDIAVKGLAATAGHWPVRELAAELLRLARCGLAQRIRDHREPDTVLSWLDPLDAVVDNGETFADQCLTRWYGDLHQQPTRYVGAYRIPGRTTG